MNTEQFLAGFIYVAMTRPAQMSSCANAVGAQYKWLWANYTYTIRNT